MSAAVHCQCSTFNVPHCLAGNCRNLSAYSEPYSHFNGFQRGRSRAGFERSFEWQANGPPTEEGGLVVEF